MAATRRSLSFFYYAAVVLALAVCRSNALLARSDTLNVPAQAHGSSSGKAASRISFRLPVKAPWPTINGPPNFAYGISALAPFPGQINYSLPDAGAAMSSVLAFDETGAMYTAFASSKGSSDLSLYAFVKFDPRVSSRSLAWRLDTPLYGTPLIGSDTVVVCWMIGFNETQAEVRLGIDRQTGKVLYNITEDLGKVPSFTCSLRSDSTVYYQQSATELRAIDTRTGALVSSVPCIVGHPWSIFTDVTGRVFAWCVPPANAHGSADDERAAVFTAFNHSGACVNPSGCKFEQLYTLPDMPTGDSGFGYSISQDSSHPGDERLVYAYTDTAASPQVSYLVSRDATTGKTIWKTDLTAFCGPRTAYSATSRISIDSPYSSNPSGTGSIYLMCASTDRFAYYQVMVAVSRDGLLMWKFATTPVNQGSYSNYGASLAANGDVFVEEGGLGAVLQLDGRTGQLLSVTDLRPRYGENGYAGPLFVYGNGQGYARRNLLTPLPGSKNIVVEAVSGTNRNA